MTAIDTAPPVAPVAPRRVSPWLVVGAVLGALMILQAAVSFVGLLVRQSDTVAVSAPAATTLVVRSSSGTITVTGTARDDIAGTAHRTWSFRQPQIVTERHGDTVELSAGCGFNLAGYCDAAFDLQVPAGTTVELRGSSGDLSATGLRGDVTLTTSSGRLAVSDVVGDVAAHTSSGDLAIAGVTGDLDLGASSGTIDVTDADAAHVTAGNSSGDIRLDLGGDPEAVDARTSSGGIAIRLPDSGDVAYRLDLHTSSGRTSGEVRTDPNSPRTISGRTSSGDVSVTYR